MANVISSSMNKGVNFIGAFFAEGTDLLHTTNKVYASFCNRYQASEKDDIRDNHDASEEQHDQFIENRLTRMSKWAEKFPQLKKSIEEKQVELLEAEYSYKKEAQKKESK